MIDVKNLPTEKLISYITLFEKFTNICVDMFQHADNAINSRVTTKVKLDPIMEKVETYAKKNDDMLLKLQNEMDRRLKQDLGTSNGISAHMKVLQEFNEFMQETMKKHQQAPGIVTGSTLQK